MSHTLNPSAPMIDAMPPRIAGRIVKKRTSLRSSAGTCIEAGVTPGSPAVSFPQVSYLLHVLCTVGRVDLEEIVHAHFAALWMKR
jgi:hypothetical protein